MSASGVAPTQHDATQCNMLPDVTQIGKTALVAWAANTPAMPVFFVKKVVDYLESHAIES